MPPLNDDGLHLRYRNFRTSPLTRTVVLNAPSLDRPDLRSRDCLMAATRLRKAAARKQERGQVASGLLTLMKVSAMNINKLRRLARSYGYGLSSRNGGWMIFDRWTNTVVDGADYNLNPSEVAERLPALAREGWAL
jgi:hypothetical protein